MPDTTATPVTDAGAEFRIVCRAGDIPATRRLTPDAVTPF
jgi:hypothetical protein